MSQPLLIFCRKESGKDVSSSTAFDEIPVSSEQLRIRQVLE
jgi:hypothetical protein